MVEGGEFTQIKLTMVGNEITTVIINFAHVIE